MIRWTGEWNGSKERFHFRSCFLLLAFNVGDLPPIRCMFCDSVQTLRQYLSALYLSDLTNLASFRDHRSSLPCFCLEYCDLVPSSFHWWSIFKSAITFILRSLGLMSMGSTRILQDLRSKFTIFWERIQRSTSAIWSIKSIVAGSEIAWFSVVPPHLAAHVLTYKIRRHKIHKNGVILVSQH